MYAHAAGRRFGYTAQDLKQRRLASAIAADDSDDFTLLDREAYIS
jgi:hypothetical protein